MDNSGKKGFTLIELLVVIAIMGLLSTFAVISLDSARKKSRDAKRISDLTQVRKALDLYFDKYQYYPQINTAYTTSDADGCGNGDKWCNLETALAPFLSKLPRDPLGLQDTYRYYYDADSGDNYQTYGIMCKFEDAGNSFLVTSDGGYYNSSGSYYELGEQPPYCMGKYTTTNRNWWGGETTVCIGGN